jgi:hypothetical protein
MPEDGKKKPEATDPATRPPETSTEAHEVRLQKAEPGDGSAPRSGSTTPGASATCTTQKDVKAWAKSILKGARDDIAKNSVIEGFKFISYNLIGLIVGGGAFWILTSIGYRDIGNSQDGPGYNYLGPIVDEVERDLGEVVSWKDPAGMETTFLYCERFVTRQSDPVERLEQFTEQFSGCVSMYARAVGQETFYDLELGPEATRPICLANADGDLVEALIFCRCDAGTMAEAAVTQAFLTETGATNVASCK